MNRSQLILGFKLEYIKDLAEDEFSNVQIAKFLELAVQAQVGLQKSLLTAWKSWLGL
jgi:hypothetical protein